jgi:HCOMODA/2-hydroxy-3-carboxy-muconic semialdehyde decarboxylase
MPAASIRMLVQASHILSRKQIVDGFGHVSTRHPENSQKFLISRSIAPALVSSEDIMTMDLSGEPCDADGRKPFLERYIHAAIYRVRPDIRAVVHSHSPAVIPFTVVPEAPLRPVCHMAGFLGDQTPIFEIRDVAGETRDMLIRTPELGTALAQRLGNDAVILMRGHGSTTVGRDIAEAVFRAVYLEVNARIQSDAMRLGAVTSLNRAEASNAAAANVGQIGRAWDLWCRELDGSGPLA